MGDVVQLDEHRPHLLIDARKLDGKMYVAPLCWLMDYAAGKPATPPTDGEMRAIVGEWLWCVNRGYVALAREELTGLGEDDAS